MCQRVVQSFVFWYLLFTPEKQLQRGDLVEQEHFGEYERLLHDLSSLSIIWMGTVLKESTEHSQEQNSTSDPLEYNTQYVVAPIQNKAGAWEGNRWRTLPESPASGFARLGRWIPSVCALRTRSASAGLRAWWIPKKISKNISADSE